MPTLKVERANCIISDTLRAYANCRKDGSNWPSLPPLFTSSSPSSPSPSIQQCRLHARRPPDAHLYQPRRAPSPPALSAARRPHRRRAAGAPRSGCGPARKSLQQHAVAESTPPTSAPAAGRPLRRDRLPEPQGLHPRPAARCGPTVNVGCLTTLFTRAGTPPAPGPGQEGEHGAALLPLRSVTLHLVRWRGRM